MLCVVCLLSCCVLLVVRRVWFVVRCWCLLDVGVILFCCRSFLLFVVCCGLFIVCCLLYVFVVVSRGCKFLCCSMLSLFVLCCLLFVVCC